MIEEAQTVDALPGNPDRRATETDTKERSTLGAHQGSLSASLAKLALGRIEPLEKIEVRLGDHRGDAIAMRDVCL